MFNNFFSKFLPFMR